MAEPLCPWLLGIPRHPPLVSCIPVCAPYGVTFSPPFSIGSSIESLCEKTGSSCFARAKTRGVIISRLIDKANTTPPKQKPFQARHANVPNGLVNDSLAGRAFLISRVAAQVSQSGSSGSYTYAVLNGTGTRPTPRRVTSPRALRSAVRFTHIPAGSELGAMAPPPESLAGSGEWWW